MQYKKVVVPVRESEFLNPTLREEEWVFGFNFIKLLNRKLTQENETARERRRAALLDDDKQAYIDINGKFLEKIVET